MNFIENILDTLSPHLFVPLFNYLKKDYSFKYVNDIETFNRKSFDEIKRYQLERIRIVADYASRNTQYYGELFKNIGLDDPLHLTWGDFARIPVLTKDIIRREQGNLLSNLCREADLRKTATGGTTSSPVPFFSDWDSLYRKRSATIVFDGWLGYRPGMKSAYLWGASQDFVGIKTFKEKLTNFLIHRGVFLPGTPLDDDILESYYQKLCLFQPYLLQAYPASLNIFAEFIKRRSYRLSIPAISCTAEPLSQSMNATITEVFKTTPYDWYGAREAGRIATECRYHDGMHINAFCLYLDVRSSEYIESSIGPLVLTDLWNIGMPLIRYEIGDVGRVVDEPCKCGSNLPRLKEILGRITDTFMNSRGQKIPGIGFTNRYIKDSIEIKSMQIVQHGIANFEILIVPAEGYSKSTEYWLQQKLNEFMLEPTGMRITVVEQIPCEKSGKVRFCKNVMSEIST